MTEVEKAKKLFRKSFPLYAKMCLKIKHKRTFETIPFTLNRAQKVLWKWFQEDLQAGKPIWWDILKARQEGFSTFFCGIMFWYATVFGKRNCLIVNHSDDTAQEMFEKVQLMQKAMPTEFKELTQRSNRKELIFSNPKPKTPDDLGKQSKIGISTCKNPDLGASKAFQVVLLSEIARYEQHVDPKTMMLALSQCVQYVPGTVIIRETTAQGEGWYKDEWDKPDSIYRKVFFSWIAAEDYRIELTVKEYFQLSTLPESKYGDEREDWPLIEAEVKRWYPEWGDDTPENKAAINHEIMCRLAMRRWLIDNKCGGDKNQFNQEYPLTAAHAFLASGANVFDNFLLDAHLKAIEEKGMKPLEFKFNSQMYKSGATDWYKRAFKQYPEGELKVYKMPVDGQVYIIGGDPCYGIADRDKAAATVYSYPEMEEVAVYNAVIEPDFFGDMLYALGMMYNTALIGVEFNGPGAATIMRLWHELSYSNLYYREIFNQTELKRSPQYGWYTDETNKPILISAGKKMVKEGTLLLSNPETIMQMKSFKELKKDKFGAPEGKHDDLVMATLIAIQMARQTHIPIVFTPAETPSQFSLQNIERLIDERDGAEAGGTLRKNMGWN